MSEAEVNGRAFLQALMSLKNKCHIKGRLLRHFGWAVPHSPSFQGSAPPPRLPMFASFCFGWFFLLFYFSSNLSLSPSLSGVLQFATQTCEIRNVLLFAPNIPWQTDLHQVQTVTNLAPFFLISAEKFPSCLSDLACCSLCLLLSGSPLFSAFSSYCPGRRDACKMEKQPKKNKPSCLGRKDCKLERGERCSRRVSHAGYSAIAEILHSWRCSRLRCV